MAVDQTRDRAVPFQINDSGRGARMSSHFLLCAHGEKLAIGDRHGLRIRVGPVEGREPAVGQDQISGH